MKAQDDLATIERLSDTDWRKVTGERTDYGQLRIATLKDSEGNLIQLLQPIEG